MPLPRRLPSRVLLSLAVWGVLWSGEAEADLPEGPPLPGNRVLGPEAAPILQDVFGFVRDCTVRAISIEGGRVTVSLDAPAGACRVWLVPPGHPAGDLPRRSGPGADLVQDGRCPTPCVDQAMEGLASGKTALVFREVQEMVSPELESESPGPGAGPEASSRQAMLGPEASVALSALLGLLLLGLLCWGAVRAVSVILAMDHGWVLLVLLGTFGGVLAGAALSTPLRSGDEWLNASYALSALWAGLHPSQYPHPALSFEVLAGLNGLRAFLHGVFTGQDLLDASVDLALRHPLDQVLLGRFLSIGSWLGVAAVTWRLAVRFGGTWWTGLLAALVVLRGEQLYPTTLSPYPLGIFLTVLSLEVSWGRGGPLRHREVVLSGLCAGAAIGTHYLAALSVPFVLLVFWIRPGDLRDKADLTARWVLWMGMGFLVTNPRFFLDLPNYLDFLHYRLQELSTFDPKNAWQRPADSRAVSPLFYWGLFRERDLRGAMLAGSLVFLTLAFRRRDPRLVFPATWGVIPVVVLSLAETRYHHYLQFLLPGAAILAFAWLPAVIPSSLGTGVRTLSGLLVAIFLAHSQAIGLPSMSSWGRGIALVDPYPVAGKRLASLPEVREGLCVGGIPLDTVGPLLQERGVAQVLGTRVSERILRDFGVRAFWVNPRRDKGETCKDRVWLSIGEISSVPSPLGGHRSIRDCFQMGALEFQLYGPKSPSR